METLEKKCFTCDKKFVTTNKIKKFCSVECSIKFQSAVQRKLRGAASDRKKVRKDPFRDDDRVFKKPLYNNVKFSANEDRVIDILKKNGVNQVIIAEVLGRKLDSIKNRHFEVNFSNRADVTHHQKEKHLDGKINISKNISKHNLPKVIEAVGSNLIYNELIKRDFKLFKVTREGAEFDLVIYKNKKFFKIQIKTATFDESQNVYAVGGNSFWKRKKLNTEHKKYTYTNYKYTNIDFFIISCVGSEHIYVIPEKNIRKIEHTNSIRFYPNRLRNNRYKKSFLETDVFNNRFDLII